MAEFPLTVTTVSGKGSALNVVEFDSNLIKTRDCVNDLNERKADKDTVVFKSGDTINGNLTVNGTINGTAVTQSPVDTTSGRLLKVGDFGVGKLALISLPNNLESTRWECIGILNGSASHIGAELSFTIFGSGNYGGTGRETLHVDIGQRDIGNLKVNVYSFENGNTQPNKIKVGYVQISDFEFYIYIKRPPYNPCTILGADSAFNGILYKQPTSFTEEPSGIIYVEPVRIYHTGNVIGTVSQSGGVPTGAIIERGSNANGEYVRLADGTQIATNSNNSITTSPATFIGTITKVDNDKLWIGRWY